MTLSIAINYVLIQWRVRLSNFVTMKSCKYFIPISESYYSSFAVNLVWIFSLTYHISYILLFINVLYNPFNCRFPLLYFYTRYGFRIWKYCEMNFRSLVYCVYSMFCLSAALRGEKEVTWYFFQNWTNHVSST